MATPNISKCQRENARIVRTRSERKCLYCGKPIAKGVKAKVYYINGLGREYFCRGHRKEDIVLSIWDLLGVI